MPRRTFIGVYGQKDPEQEAKRMTVVRAMPAMFDCVMVPPPMTPMTTQCFSLCAFENAKGKRWISCTSVVAAVDWRPPEIKPPPWRPPNFQIGRQFFVNFK